jgi:hypothetical protein
MRTRSRRLCHTIPGPIRTRAEYDISPRFADSAGMRIDPKELAFGSVVFTTRIKLCGTEMDGLIYYITSALLPCMLNKVQSNLYLSFKSKETTVFKCLHNC